MRPAPAWALPRCFVHRGGGALAPENTLAGLRIAALTGFRAVEFDVTLSADGTPWLIHDATLERTTTGHGRVAATPDHVLASLDAGVRHHPAFAGEPLPTLAAAAALCRALALVANVEIKPADGSEAATGACVAAEIAALWQGAPLPLVSSFSFEALLAARQAVPLLPLACLWHRPPADWRVQADRLGAFSVHCAAEAVAEGFLSEAREAGVPVLCYTVNGRELAAQCWSRGMVAVFSDRPDLLAQRPS
ncbi:glycerophosphodiester phosphodiesterase [Rhodocyclus tenuis]|nr:glycerophosphodiester phosphodiesterase [Rhodocyclus gracilis]